VGDVLEPDFSSAADVQRERAVRAVLRLGNGIADACGIVQEGTEDVGIEHQLDGVPLSRPQAGVRPRNRRRDAGGERRQRWWPACTRRRRCGSGTRRRQRHTQLSAARRSQPLFGCLRALTVQRHAIRGKIAFVQRYEDPFETAVSRALGAQHHASLAARRASKRGEDSDVLIGLVSEQPSAGSGCGRADDLAVLGAPAALTDRLPSTETRTREHHVGCEVRRRAVEDGRKSCHSDSGRERRAVSILHDISPSSGAD
jgi:hypothetical protein